MRLAKALVFCGALGLTNIANSAGSHQHWGYKGDDGPEHWGELTSEFSTCKSGTRQSPIDIHKTGVVKAHLSKLSFNYQSEIPHILNNGHTVQLDYAQKSYTEIAGQRYKLLQLHFHTPSENIVDGKPYNMEMHLVHADDAGNLAVVGVFLKNGKQNKVLQKAWNQMPTKAGQRNMLKVAVNPADLLPEDKSYHHFKGSLTTPPCSEGVNWYVMKQPIEVSAEQIKQFAKVIGNNARPVQQLNDRFVLANTQ